MLKTTGAAGHVKQTTEQKWRHLSFTHLVGLILVLGVISFGINSLLLSRIDLDHTNWQRESRDASIHYFNRGQPSSRFCKDIENGANGPLVCGHGGDKAMATVNTIRSFSKAISESGATCLEMDASLTADNYLVVLHPREISTRLGKPVNVNQFSLEELQRDSETDANGEDLRVPLLVDALKEFSPLVSEIIVDIKDTGPGVANVVAEAVVRADCDNCLLWSKDDQIVEELIEIMPEMQIGLIVRNETFEDYERGSYEPIRIDDAQVLGVHYEMVNETLVDLAHR